MADSRIVYRNCIPDGTIDIQNVDPGGIIQRDLSFRCNAPPEVQEQLDSGAWDPRNILTGSDGQLFDGDGNFLAQVNTFNAQVNFTNIDYDAAGEQITWAIPNRYTVSLTFTETVIRDADLLAKVLNGTTAGGRRTYLNFQGVLRGHNIV